MKILKYLLKKNKETRKEQKFIPPPDELKLLVFADLHWMNDEDWETIRSIKKFGADAIVLLGDIMLEEARAIAENTPKGIPILAVYGNHDVWGMYDKIPRITDLGSKQILISNTKFTGLSGAPKYKEGSERCMISQEDAIDIMADMPHADILLCHDGPYHLFTENKAHEGFVGVTDYIEKQKPSLVLFGHHHESYEGYLGQTKTICVFRCAMVNTHTGEISQIF